MIRTLFHSLAFVLILATTAMAADLSSLMPDTVGDLKRIQLVTGKDAQIEVDKLHGKALEAEESCIARYSKPEDVGMARPSEVWMSRVSSEKEARRQTGLMVHKMYENPKSPFRNPRRIDHEGQSVYRFAGMGQVHFIWFSGDMVYWISCSATDQDALLDAFARKE